MDSVSPFEERSQEGSLGELWMLKSPATRYVYSRSRRDDSGETEWGAGGSGWAEELPILKRWNLEPKQPCGVKTSKAIKSSVSEGKNCITANSSRKCWET